MNLADAYKQGLFSFPENEGKITYHIKEGNVMVEVDLPGMTAAQLALVMASVLVSHKSMAVDIAKSINIDPRNFLNQIASLLEILEAELVK